MARHERRQVRELIDIFPHGSASITRETRDIFTVDFKGAPLDKLLELYDQIMAIRGVSRLL